MASDKLLLRTPQWTDPDIKWYILSKPAKRILGKSGNVPAGTIFQVDYEASQLHENFQKEIVLKSCQKGAWKVKWAPQTFYGLDDGSKDLLLSVLDQNDRLRFYLASQASLQYGKTLEIGDDVCVRLPKRKELMVKGVVMYKGPVDEESSAMWFGVELVSNCGDTDGIFKKTGVRYFTCEPGRGQFVTIKSIVPTSVSEEEKQKLLAHGKKDTDVSSRSSDAATNIGVSDIFHLPVIRVGDEVLLRTQMGRGGKPQLVVGHIVLVHGEHVAVNVVKQETPVFKPWNGHFNGVKIYNDANEQTVWLGLNEIELTYSHSSTASCKEKDSMPKPYASAIKEGKFHHSPPCRDDPNLEQLLSNIKSTCNEMQENVWKTDNLSEECRLEDFAPHQGSILFSYGSLPSDEGLSSLQDIGKMKQPGKPVRRSSSLSVSKDISSHPPKQGKQSGGKDNSSGNFMTSIKNVFSGKRGDSTRSPEEEIANTKEIAQEEEIQKNVTREVTDLQGQLEIMKTKYSDTVKRLEEESQKMNSLELKNAELELELQQTKHDQASFQEEVERLKKELEDYKKQTRLENETGKHSKSLSTWLVA